MFKYNIFLRLLKQKRDIRHTGNVLLTDHNLKFIPQNAPPKCRFFHTGRNPYLAKIFLDTENAFAYNVITRDEPSLNPLKTGESSVIVNEQQFDHILNHNFRQQTPQHILSTFELVLPFCVNNSITVTDPRFDQLVDGLMDNCEKFTPDQLQHLLHLLIHYPPTESTVSHNFHDIWTCLDDMCCWQLNKWDLPTCLRFAELWFNLNLVRKSDFVFELLDRLNSRPKRLTTGQLLQTYFYTNVCRKKKVEFDVEHVLCDRINELNVDELGVVAMAYFKSQTKIRHQSILSAMIQSVMQSPSVHQVTLASILKAIRYTPNYEMIPEIEAMLDSLHPQLDQLTDATLVHVALIGTNIQYRHEKTLKKCTEILLGHVDDIRLKDIERIVLSNAMFYFDPGTLPEFYKRMCRELHTEKRLNESITYDRCLPSALHYLSIKKVYSYSLMNRMLDEDFIDEVFGKNPKLLPRQLLSLDASIDIECSDYTGNRLSPARKYRAVKWLTDFSPDEQWGSLSNTQRIHLDVANNLVEILGGNESLVKSDHVLPHFQRPDIIVCRNKTSGDYVEPFGFENYILGDVKRPLRTDEFDWTALMFLPHHLIIKGTNLPLGFVVMKVRHLKAVGYRPILIPFNEYPDAKNDKLSYLKSKLSQPDTLC